VLVDFERRCGDWVGIPICAIQVGALYRGHCVLWTQMVLLDRRVYGRSDGEAINQALPSPRVDIVTES